MPEKQATTNVRFPPDLFKLIQAEAKKRGIPQNTLIVESVRRGLIDLDTEIYRNGFSDGFKAAKQQRKLK